ncbi:MAG: hypothetical protein Q9217_002387 [Psora testacea]
MVPKPFPYPISIGTDICNVYRIAGLLRLRDVRERWVKRTFTRLEWPAIWQSFLRVRLNSDGKKSIGVKDYDFFVKKAEDAASELDEEDKSGIWRLPDLSTSDIELRIMAKESFNKMIGDEKSPLGQLTRHLAGRWAAKEAVIKAHSYRRVYMNEISIITPRLFPAIFPLKEALKMKTVALIDPPCNKILMDERVAKIRALRGFGPRSSGMWKGNVVTESGDRPQIEEQGQLYYKRRSKVNESERQIADVSISHDGAYAVAVCMALNEPGNQANGECIIDDGEGLRKHEPNWGDEGWFTMERVTHEDEDPTSDPEYYKKAIDDFFKTEQEKVPFLD